MRIVHFDRSGRTRDSGPIFEGLVDRQTIVGEESSQLRLAEVTFRAGARNRKHVHATDQILIVTEGLGFVATEQESRDVGPGDVAFVPKGERHWHGAKPGKDMTHLVILGPGKTEIVGD